MLIKKKTKKFTAQKFKEFWERCHENKNRLELSYLLIFLMIYVIVDPNLEIISVYL